MTMKRSLSVLLVLCMALSRLLCGMSVYAEGGTPAESPAFERSVMVDGVIITVKAPEGVFPADAVLWAENVSNAEQEKIDTAVEEALDAGKKVGASYAFDVKLLDAAGYELQPPEGSDVRISFVLDRVNDANLEPEIYHITESEAGGRLSAEKLESEADRSAATVAPIPTAFHPIRWYSPMSSRTIPSTAMRSDMPETTQCVWMIYCRRATSAAM